MFDTNQLCLVAVGYFNSNFEAFRFILNHATNAVTTSKTLTLTGATFT